MTAVRAFVATVAVCIVATACSTERTIGPLSITPPSGWYVTDSTNESIKVTNGTVGDERSTKPGTATAVFDVYINSPQTVGEFERALRKENVRPRKDDVRIGGYDAVIVAYGSSSFGPSTEVVFIPSWRVRIVYRAAYGNEESAFAANRSAFRTALRSIRFSGRPPARA